MTAWYYRILGLQQGGLIQRWYSKHMVPDPCSSDSSFELHPVTLSDVSNIFTYVMAGGLACACAVLLLEGLVYLVHAFHNDRRVKIQHTLDS